MARLYVGADESNHGGKKGEIVVATFSTNLDDSIVRIFRNGRNFTLLDSWLESAGVDYRFTILLGDGRNGYSNLPRIVPHLIAAYMQENEGLHVDSLNIYFDGRLSSRDKRTTQSSIPGIDRSRVHVDSFIKKQSISLKGRRRCIKRPNCPKVVYMADILANNLFSNKSLEELSKDPRMVVIKQ